MPAWVRSRSRYPTFVLVKVKEQKNDENFLDPIKEEHFHVVRLLRLVCFWMAPDAKAGEGPASLPAGWTLDALNRFSDSSKLRMPIVEWANPFSLGRWKRLLEKFRILLRHEQARKPNMPSRFDSHLRRTSD